MGYISDLRRYVGHDPLIMVGAGIIFLDPSQRALLCRRADNGMWALAGGALEPGETLEETARREAREEIGLEPGVLELFNVFSGPAISHTYPNGDQVYNVTVVYLSCEPRGEIRFVDGEVTEARYFSPEEVNMDEVSPPDRPILEAYFQWYRERGDYYGRNKSQSEPRSGADAVGGGGRRADGV